MERADEDGDADDAPVATIESAREQADAGGPAYRVEVIEETPSSTRSGAWA